MKSFWQSSGSCQFVFHWFYRSNNRHSDVRHWSTSSLSNTLANPKELKSYTYGPQLILATSKATVCCYNKRCNCCTQMTPLIYKLLSRKQALLSWLFICSRVPCQVSHTGYSVTYKLGHGTQTMQLFHTLCPSLNCCALYCCSQPRWCHDHFFAFSPVYLLCILSALSVYTYNSLSLIT